MAVVVGAAVGAAVAATGAADVADYADVANECITDGSLKELGWITKRLPTA